MKKLLVVLLVSFVSCFAQELVINSDRFASQLKEDAQNSLVAATIKYINICSNSFPLVKSNNMVAPFWPDGELKDVNGVLVALSFQLGKPAIEKQTKGLMLDLLNNLKNPENFNQKLLDSLRFAINHN